MASSDSSGSPCQIVRRSCNLRPVCSQCHKEAKAARCFHCTKHGHTYKLCESCYANRVASLSRWRVVESVFDPVTLAEAWCRLQRGKGIYHAADRD